MPYGIEKCEYPYDKATYQICEEAHGNGTFFYTDCCNNRMYSVQNNDMLYHGCLFPKCFWGGKNVTLYLRGTDEAKKVFEMRGDL